MSRLFRLAVSVLALGSLRPHPARLLNLLDLPARIRAEGPDTGRLRELAVLRQPLADRAGGSMGEQDIGGAIAVEVARPDH